MVIADLDVIQLDFRGTIFFDNSLLNQKYKTLNDVKLLVIFSFAIEGDNVDCWMEIQSGKGPWAPPVSGIVPIGSTLTLVVAINDYRGNFLSYKLSFKIWINRFGLNVMIILIIGNIIQTI